MCIRCGHCEVSCPQERFFLIISRREDLHYQRIRHIVAGRSRRVHEKKAVSSAFHGKPSKKRKYRISLKSPGTPHRGATASLSNGSCLMIPATSERLPAYHRLDEDPAEEQSSHERVCSGINQQAGKRYDVVCRGAPHLLISHIPDGNPSPLSTVLSP